jgi:AcrR family transcriptional regulator
VSPTGRTADFALDADDIVSAAVEIFHESGLDAVSMRSVAGRLGVSPVPLYSRVGNKEALVDALADRLFADMAPPVGDDEPWADYATRWAQELRARLGPAHDSRLILSVRREAFVEASRPLVEVLRRDGFAADAAVQSCRLLMWATVGFVAVESGATPSSRLSGGPSGGPSPGRPGGDPGGVDAHDADALFHLHIRHLVGGIASDADHGPHPIPGAHL